MSLNNMLELVCGFHSEDSESNLAPAATASPFRRAWVQSSFRTPRTDKHTQQSPLVHRTASMTASDNDVYIKSMDVFIDELKQTHSQQQINAGGNIAPIMPSKIFSAGNNNNKSANIITAAGVSQTSAIGPSLGDPTERSVTGVTAWGTSFERLLEDAAGLHTFAEFLKKEFSAENIYFWTACERFRHLEHAPEREEQALAIFSKHLANGATEPVNVDSQARNLTEEKLRCAERDIFSPAQKQIFNLMKFDSYQRFIRSDLYKKCLEAEQKNQPLPYAADDLDELLRTHLQQGASAKLKKSASNAEDRRRKSLLPWHRKTRSKSRDGAEGELAKPAPPAKLSQLSSSSLKIPSASAHNSASDVHSSRSSLSSFDAFPAASAAHAEAACSLCRVILSDGATTIVQTRPGDTVAQLIERLLEKRGLSYKFYSVVDGESYKAIDLHRAAMTLAGKQVLIEQGVAFKLDLPDPKVISVKSKPKKQLHEVIRPILHKYNYSMEDVEVLRRDTQTPLDLSLPVSVADGQRLQIVLLQQPALGHVEYQNDCSTKFAKPAPPKGSVTFARATKPSSQVAGGGVARAAAQQNNLDEITNKVFNELLQSKVESAAVAGEKPMAKASDLCSVKSDDCGSENSSVFERLRRRDSNLPGFKLKSKKKSSSSQHTEDSATAAAQLCASIDMKKPIIAKLKAGVKLQVTERVVEHQDELLEGLKRAQLARLEDQRGTEINSELPEFLKNKENMTASKLRKVRANLSPVSKTTFAPLTPTPAEDAPSSPFAPAGERPQPAPRLSISNRQKASSVSPMKIDEETTPECQAEVNGSSSSLETDYAAGGSKGPPPLPPKPKVLPIKPNNWGVCNSTSVTVATTPTPTKSAPFPTSVITPATAISIALPLASKIASAEPTTTTRCAYLDEPSSSFV